MFFNMYPYTDGHELNLDWILAQIKKLNKDFDEFTALNTITNSGAWDITRQYPRWTLVSDNNAGYISIQPVPAGITLDNTDYWVLVADYDVLITDLSDRISDLENAVDTINNTTIPTVEGDISKTQYMTGTKRPRKVVFLGDSFGQTNPAWQVEVRQKLNITDYVDSFTGGNGFMMSDGSEGFLQQLQNVVITEPEKVTHLVVVGGTNDMESAHITDLAGAIQSFCATARTMFPNALIYIGFAGTKYRSSDLSSGLTEYRSIADYYYQMGCAAGGAKYVGGMRFALSLANRLQSDLVHPNASGTSVISTTMTNAILGGTGMNCTGIDVLTKGSIDNAQYAGTWECQAGREVNIFTLKWGGAMKVNINDNDYHTLMSYSDLPCFPMTNTIRKIANVRISGTWYECMFILSASGLELIIINSGQSIPAGLATMVEDVTFYLPC